MADSNAPTDFSSIFVRLAETQKNAIQGILSKNFIIIVHDDDDKFKHFQQLSVAESESTTKLHVFDNDEQCAEFVMEKVSDDPNVKFVVFAGGRLVCDLVSSIRFCDQVQGIYILNEPPFSEEEQEMMKNYPKVKVTDRFSCD
jgi:hypothetical protein